MTRSGPLPHLRLIGFGFLGFSVSTVLILAPLAGCADPQKVSQVRAGTQAETPSAFDPARARDAINAYRASRGLAPLTIDKQLARAALIQAEDIARRDLLDHEGSDGSTLGDRVARTGYRAVLTAENIAAGQATFEEVLQGWKKSRLHDRNLLLAEARDMGIAMVSKKNARFRTFWTLVIAAPSKPENRSRQE